MGLNEIIDKALTSEQKSRFQSDNGKFKILKNIVILPIVTAILGIYLESIPIVTVSIICIIAFLILYSYNAISRKNVIYDKVIIPIVLEQKFSNVETVDKIEDIVQDFKKSMLISDYSKIKCEDCFKIIEDRYEMNIAKVVTTKVNIEESDGVVEKHEEENFCGAFASIKLPKEIDTEFSVIKNIKEDDEILSADKLDAQQVRMGIADFDKNYDVYSMDQVSVKRILSPGAIARIMDINQSISNLISFSVYEDVLYIAINEEKFLDFKGKNKEYVDEQVASENLNIVEALDYFIKYFLNIIEA